MAIYINEWEIQNFGQKQLMNQIIKSLICIKHIKRMNMELWRLIWIRQYMIWIKLAQMKV